MSISTLRAAAPAIQDAPTQQDSTTAIGTGVSISGISKQYDQTQVLRDVSLQVRSGEFLSLLGPSGCGKTTLLRILAGLIRPDSGSVHFGEQAVSDAREGRHVPAEHRNLGMVFQDYALWPHMRVEKNVAFPLETRGTVPPEERAARVQKALERVGLSHLARRYPEELSGGQQQRVALARAIVAEPRVVLFDEPLSNLDAGLRESLGREISILVRSLGLTAIYVTHDQGEALALSDRIAVMRQGEIVQCGSPEALYGQPADAWVAEFLNAGSLLRGDSGNGLFTAPGLSIPLTGSANARGTLLLPANAVLLSDTGDIELRVTTSQFRGERHEIHASPSGGLDNVLRFWSPRAFVPGAIVHVTVDSARLRFYAGTETPVAPFPSNQPLSQDQS